MDEMNDNVAQEMAMHVALCVCSEYVKSWGMAEFLVKLEEYSSEPTLPFIKNYALKIEREL